MLSCEPLAMASHCDSEKYEMSWNILNAVRKAMKVCDEGGTIEYDVGRIYDIKLK